MHDSTRRPFLHPAPLRLAAAALVAFIGAYYAAGIYAATTALMVAMAVLLAVDWLRTRPLAHFEHGHLMVHAGVLPAWDAQRTCELADEVHQALGGPDPLGFLKTMYGNEPATWDESLRGADRLRGDHDLPTGTEGRRPRDVTVSANAPDVNACRARLATVTHHECAGGGPLALCGGALGRWFAVAAVQ